VSPLLPAPDMAQGVEEWAFEIPIRPTAYSEPDARLGHSDLGPAGRSERIDESVEHAQFLLGGCLARVSDEACSRAHRQGADRRQEFPGVEVVSHQPGILQGTHTIDVRVSPLLDALLWIAYE